MRRSTALAWSAALAWSTACGGRTQSSIPDPETDAGTDAPTEAGPPSATFSERLDVLFVVDNTRTAVHSHRLVADAIPKLLERLGNPVCVNGLGQVVDRPADVDTACSVGLREFAPIRDAHIGFISTSIGGHGADTCSPTSVNFNPEQNDGAHLLDRSSRGGTVPTYEGDGFLVWDPNASHDPPGSTADAVSDSARLLLDGVGARGCGFEAPLEAMYRFLIDPNPYESIDSKTNAAVLTGTDAVVLQQRSDFLRSDSSLLVVLVSDENDCSTRDGGQYFFSNQNQVDGFTYHLPRARTACASNPNDDCCTSCGAALPAGCDDDDRACQQPPFSESEDPINLRCFDQKRRFGIDFLYPISRYVDGLTAMTVADRNGEIHTNPLFSGNRQPEHVVLTAIAGVPWQDIALSTNNIAAGFKPTYDIDWALIVGDDETLTPPADPLMVPSREPRSGTHPLLGTPLAPPDTTVPDANPINGHEHTLDNQLQFACVYPLATALDCSDGSCECEPDNVATNVLCQADDGSYTTTQRRARATPATRQLQLVRALGGQGALASICAAEVNNPDLDSHGYKPAVDAMLRALRPGLTPWAE